MDWVAEFEKVKPGEERKALYCRYLKSGWWRQVRMGALQRAEERCQLCYSDSRLQVHHRTYERVGREKPADVFVLCDSCHNHFHNKKKPKKRKAKKPRPRTQEKSPQIKVMKGGKTADFLARLYDADLQGNYTTVQLSRMFSVSKSAVGTFMATGLQRKTKGIERIGKKKWRIAYGPSSPESCRPRTTKTPTSTTGGQ